MTKKTPSTDNRAATGHQAHVLLFSLAIFSIALLGLATVAIASSSAATPVPAAPMELPPVGSGDASISGASVSGTATPTWLVAGKPGAITNRIANRAGASAVGSSTGIFRVKSAHARVLASRLNRKGHLVFAEPNVSAVKSSYPADLYSASEWWLNRIVNPTVTTPPSVGEFSPELALIEESVDPLHPDLTTARLAGTKSLSPGQDWHGTAIAGIAGSPGEGLGIRGVWPGMKMRLIPMGTTCVTATKAILRAIRAKSAVLNMSYGFPDDSCYSHYVATELAVQKGILPVAAAGNTNGEGGNVAMRPATDPHVLSVSAIDEKGLVASFATQNAGVDITAPGAGVFAPTVTLTPGVAGITRGWANLDGTSFSTPMVAAAATWLRQSRPNLDARQVGRALTSSATDLGTPGRDQQYGEGVLNIDAALTVSAPPRDPMEPNDDIGWLNGSLLKKKAMFLWRPGKGRRKAINATISRSKDPADVYRVKLAPKSKVLITTAQLQGDVELKVFKPKTKSILRPGKNLIVKSDRPRTKIEGVRVRNRKGKAQIVYVSITPSSRTLDEYSRYRLAVIG